jgi:hypothetical protein
MSRRAKSLRDAQESLCGLLPLAWLGWLALGVLARTCELLAEAGRRKR